MLPQKENKPLRKLNVDMPELIFALENASYEMDHFLDVETGEVIMVSEEARSTIESIEMDMEEDAALADFYDALQKHDLQDWVREDVNKALEIEADFGSRYIGIPKATSREGYRDMEDFIYTVEDKHLQDLLSVAIDGKGAFRRFKNVLYNYPQEQERWFAFQGNRVEEQVLAWLKSEGIQPINENENLGAN